MNWVTSLDLIHESHGRSLGARTVAARIMNYFDMR